MLADHSIDMVLDNVADGFAVDGNADFEVKGCVFMDSDLTTLDCGPNRDGVADYYGTRVVVPVNSATDANCNLYSGTTASGSLAWMLEAGSTCPPLVGGRLEARGALTDDKKLKIAGATFTRASNSNYFDGKIVSVWGTVIGTTGLDIDHDGVADILTSDGTRTTRAPETTFMITSGAGSNLSLIVTFAVLLMSVDFN